MTLPCRGVPCVVLWCEQAEQNIKARKGHSMDRQEAAETLGEFGPLFYHLGSWLAGKYKHQQDTLEHFVCTLHSILKTCREDDRHAILVVIAVTIVDVYHYYESSVADKLWRVIAAGNAVSVEIHADDRTKNALKEAFTQLQDFLQHNPFFCSSRRFDFLDRAEGFTAMKDLSCRMSRGGSSNYCLNVCAFIACAGYENLPMLFSKHSSYVKNLFLRNIPKVGSYGMVSAVNRLWNQFKLYDCQGTQGDRFILPFLLSRNPDVAVALEQKEELSSHQLMKLADAAEVLLPVMEAATFAAENSFCDGLHTKLPDHWVIEYATNDGVVEYEARDHDYELLGWVYQQCGVKSNLTFTDEPAMSDEDLAL